MLSPAILQNHPAKLGGVADYGFWESKSLCVIDRLHDFNVVAAAASSIGGGSWPVP